MNNILTHIGDALSGGQAQIVNVMDAAAQQNAIAQASMSGILPQQGVQHHMAQQYMKRLPPTLPERAVELVAVTASMKKVAELFAAQLSMEFFKDDPIAASIYIQAMERAISILEKGDYKV